MKEQILEMASKYQALGYHELAIEIRRIANEVDRDKSRVVDFESPYVNGNFVFLRSRRTVVVEGDERELRVKEFDLLDILSSNENRTVQYFSLIDSLWGDSDAGNQRNLSMVVYNLRTKLQGRSGCYDPVDIIKAVRGSGLMLVNLSSAPTFSRGQN